MRRWMVHMLVAVLMLCLALPVSGQQTEPTRIYTVEDLLKITQDPQGNYILMEDLDLSGIPWPCPDFYGSFDGNGHAILNLTLNQPGSTVANAYDGNRKSYESQFAGFFGILKDARVENLNLINVRGYIDTQNPFFLAGVAGYMENSTISGCTITGSLELRAHDRIFGIGGIVGYGCGIVEHCTADVTLICVDTNAETKDEQFLGGAYATGFINLDQCKVALDGYISEHGYVHSGGLTGMYMQYPWGKEETGSLRDNYVEGKITFFEHNSSRRAYCDAFVGESLVYYKFYKGNNISKFKRDERYQYDQELRPEMCEKPEYSKETTQPDCDHFGYTTYTCTGCGYQYTDRYTLKRHVVNKWVMELAPTTQEEGRSVGACRDCGKIFTQVIPKLEMTTVPTTVPAGTTQPSEPMTEQETENPDGAWLLWLAGGAVVLAVLVLTLSGGRKRK